MSLAIGELEGTCWLDPVSQQRSCEPWVWTPGAVEELMRTTGDNFRTVHAQVQRCRAARAISDEARQEWARLYNRWVAWTKSEPSMYWSATPNTILSYIKELNSWSQMLRSRGGACIPGAELQPTEDPEDNTRSLWAHIVDKESLKWTVGGIVALTALYGVKALKK